MTLDPGLFDGRYLLPTEDPEEFSALVEEHLQRYPNLDVVLGFYVESLIHDAWSLRRYQKALRQITEAAGKRNPDGIVPPELNHPTFQMFHKHVASLQSRYNQTVRCIQRLQKDLERDEGRARKLGSFRQKSAKSSGPFLVTSPRTKPN